MAVQAVRRYGGLGARIKAHFLLYRTRTAVYTTVVFGA